MNVMRLLPFTPSMTIDKERIQPALDYIEQNWATLLRENYEDNGTLIGLPHPYIVPSIGTEYFKFEEQYYWDSYFTALGLTHPDHQPLVEGMLDNLLHLYRRFGIIPNGSRMYFLSRSQPPLLTSFIFLLYDRYGKSTEWLEETMKVAESEYHRIWMSSHHPVLHNVHKGLSRYYDINVLHDLAEAESGWDMTTRFDRKCLDYLPVDLNSLLYKYEMDFARTAEITGSITEAEKWRTAAETRLHHMTELMWGKVRGYFFDYNYNKEKSGDVWSLAGFYTMWAGLATPSQANRMVDNLDKFEKAGGLATTSRPLIDTSLLFGSLKTQWAYPNGWAPLHYIVIEGLKRYGYHEDAKRIAKKWLMTNTLRFEKHGAFYEKYNVVSPHKRPVEGVYESQDGFGWTNGVYAYLANEYV